MIIFGSVRFLSKTSNQTEKNNLKKKTKTGSNRQVSVRFGFFREKTGSNRFGSVFPVLAWFFRFGSVFQFGSVFPVWLGFGSVFFRIFFSSVRFFRFFAYKTETKPAGFFKILIGLIGFFFRFFFSRFNWFFDFFAHP